jgi:hypothetical protein
MHLLEIHPLNPPPTPSISRLGERVLREQAQLSERFRVS